MPLMPCTRSGRSGWKWGESGHCYIGPDAKANAARQGRAIQAQQKHADARRRKLNVKALYPHRVEDQYNRWVLRRIRAMNKMVEQALIAELRKLKPEIDERAKERGRRVDTEATTTNALMQTLNTTKHRWGANRASRVERKQLELFAKNVDSVATANMERQVLSVLSIDAGFNHGPTAALHRRWVTENVKLIKTVDARYFAQLEAEIRQGVAEGRTTKYLTEQIQQRGHVSRTNATRIARTEIGKLNSRITQQRHEDVGITQYAWRTVGDERVRDEHAELEGTTHKWSEAPAEGHPGTPIQCRCYPEPLISGTVERAMIESVERFGVIDVKRMAA